MILSTLIYLERGDDYLMLHRVKKKNDANKDKWIGVGGKFEPGETPEACARRETFEETGLTMLSLRYRGIVHFSSDLYESEDMHLFTCDRFEGVLKECDEGELVWLDRHELLKKQIWEGDRIFLKLLDKNRPFFDLSLVYQGDSLKKAMLDGVELTLPFDFNSEL